MSTGRMKVAGHRVGSPTRAEIQRGRELLGIAKMRLEIAERHGKLLDADAVRLVWSRFVGQLSFALERLPKRAAGSVVAALSLPADKHAAVMNAIAEAVAQARDSLVDLKDMKEEIDAKGG